MSTGPTSFDNGGDRQDDGDAPLCRFRAVNGEPCLAEADWVIVWDSDEDRVQETCSAHLVPMLGEASEYIVYPSTKTIHAVTDEDVEDEEFDSLDQGISLHSMGVGERITCPRRVEVTDGYTEPNCDFWEHRDWDHFQRCSYCGSVRPADALGLLKTGWEARATDRPYKFEMHPIAGDATHYKGAVYKVYAQHFTTDQFFAEFLTEAFGGTWKRKGGRWVREK